MAKTSSKRTETNAIEVTALEQGEVTFWLLGTTPFYCNRVSEKAKRELLMPRGGRLTAAQKEQNLKHDPDAEFRDSPYLRRVDDPGPTRILMKATALKGAIGQAAIDMPTAVARAQIDRLTYVVDEYIDIWGIPFLNMEVVRMADIGRTPDIRTRAKLPRWATRVTVRYTRPMLTANKVATLISASGIICGIGDFRQQKGKGSNGLYEIVSEDDPRLLEIIQTGGREAQDAALADPICSDPETQDLRDFFYEELTRRRDAPTATVAVARAPRRTGNGEAPVA